MTDTTTDYGYGVLSVWGCYDTEGKPMARFEYTDLYEAMDYLWEEHKIAKGRYTVRLQRQLDNKSLTISLDGVLSAWEQ